MSIWSSFNYSEFLFKIFAVSLAPGFFIPPKNCPITDKKNCNLWNCEEHYFNNKYCICRRS